MTRRRPRAGRAAVTHRRALGLSQRDVAAAIGISPQYLNDIEHGRREPTDRELLGKIAAVLDIDLDVLLFAAGLLPADVPDNPSPATIRAAFAAMRAELTP